MSCCNEFDQALADHVIAHADAREILDGPLMNQIMSEYYLLRKRAAGYSYYPINYCPFCGMPRSAAIQGFNG